MNKNDELNPDRIPDEFPDIERASEFWDQHNLDDYWHETSVIEIEVRASRREWVALAAHLARQTEVLARQEGVSVETLVNLWVAERLQPENQGARS